MLSNKEKLKKKYQSNENNEVNKTLYSFKAIAALFVIYLHLGSSGKYGMHIINIARFAVPLFFVIAGYFSFYLNKKEMDTILKKRLRKIGKITLISFIIYFFINLMVNHYYNSMNNYINELFNYSNVLKFLILNWTTPIIGVGHLWYLFAILYVYIIMLFVNKFNLYKLSYAYSILAIIAMYSLEIYNSINHLNIAQIYYRNAWIMGFSFFIMGYLIRKHSSILKEYKNKLLIILFITTPIIYFMEYNILNIMNNDNCLFIFNILVVFLMLVIAINYKNINIFSNIGKNYSSNIYIIHYTIIILFRIIFKKYYNPIINIFLPFIIFILSLIISILYKYTKKRIN